MFEWFVDDCASVQARLSRPHSESTAAARPRNLLSFLQECLLKLGDTLRLPAPLHPSIIEHLACGLRAVHEGGDLAVLLLGLARRVVLHRLEMVMQGLDLILQGDESAPQ